MSEYGGMGTHNTSIVEKYFFFTITGNLIGSIQQDWSLLGPKYSILNSQGQKNLTIKGPFRSCGSICAGDIVFRVLSGQ